MTKKSKPSLNFLEKYGFRRQSPGTYYKNNIQISSVPTGYQITTWTDDDSDEEYVTIFETIKEVKDYLTKKSK
jgi:hypothetical protein